MTFKMFMVLPVALSAMSAFGKAAEVDLYRAVRKISDIGIRVKPWASGTISETDETSFEGGRSLRITSRNFFQGGILDFSKPVDLTAKFNEPKSVLRISLRVIESAQVTPSQPTINPGRGGSGVGGGQGEGGGGVEGLVLSAPGSVRGIGFSGFQLQSPGNPAGLPPGVGGPGGPGSLRGGQPGFANQVPTTVTLPPMNTLRVILTTTDGKHSEVYLPVSQVTPDLKGWRSMAVPLSAINGFKDTSKVVRSIQISCDILSTFYVGEIRMVEDETPLSGEIYARANENGPFTIINQANVALNDQVEFRGVGTGGATLLRYEWSFDASQGIQVDAVGQVVRIIFRKAGTFTVTLTIKDKYGSKKPVARTMVITVNP